MAEEALLGALEGAERRRLGVSVQGVLALDDAGRLERLLDVLVDDLEGAGIGVVDAPLLGRERMFEDVDLDAVIGERPCSTAPVRQAAMRGGTGCGENGVVAAAAACCSYYVPVPNWRPWTRTTTARYRGTTYCSRSKWRCARQASSGRGSACPATTTASSRWRRRSWRISSCAGCGASGDVGAAPQHARSVRCVAQEQREGRPGRRVRPLRGHGDQGRPRSWKLTEPVGVTMT